MIEEKQTARSCKKMIGILICTYIIIVAGYYWGRDTGKRIGLEYRFWVDACFHIWVWFVPVFFFGGLLLKAYIRQRKGKKLWRCVLTVLLVGYIGLMAYLSLLYVLVGVFTLTSDKKMPDGNLVVASGGLAPSHHYAEPVGLLFRRKFSFDEERTADSLSKIYGATFRPLRKENDQWIYGSDAYPGIELTNISYSFIEAYYLDNNMEWLLTSKMLEKHQDVFYSRGVELVPKDLAAEAIAEFIKITLKKDLRPDGKKIWKCVNGWICLVTDTEENGKYQSICNIPFPRKPQYSGVFNASVTAEEIAEEIVIKKS